jgi:hypothetical protein
VLFPVVSSHLELTFLPSILPLEQWFPVFNEEEREREKRKRFSNNGISACAYI